MTRLFSRTTTFLFSALLFTLLVSQSAFAAQIKLAWDPNTETDLAGYRVYWGETSRSYGSPIDVGKVTQFTLTGLTAGKTYFFAVTAYDFSNNESNKSYEVSGAIYRDLIFHDDFEDYTVGNPPPSPWFSLSGGPSNVTNLEYQSGTKSIVVSGGPYSCQSSVIDLGDTYPNRIGYEVWAKVNSSSSGAFVGFLEQIGGMAPQFNAVYFNGNDGRVYFVSSDQNHPVSVKLLDSFALGVWHKVHVEIDFANLKADVYIDDVLVGNHIPASPKNAVWNGNSFQLRKVGVMHYFGDPFYFDNFSVFPWTPHFVTDFDGDGISDILWRHGTTGEAAIWLMNGMTISSSGYLPTVSDPNWQIVGMGDFDGDGKVDILWRHATTGEAAIWLMNGMTISSSAYLPTVSDLNWKIVGVGDFDGDGKADILWRHATMGEAAIWLMNGMTISSSAYLPTVSDLNWKIVGVGDFDGDGKADILWRHATMGEAAIWLMNGMTISSSAYLPTVSDPNWKIVGVGDFDGDGKVDILWRHATTGEAAIWLMNGMTISSSAYLPTVSDLNWKIVGVGDFDGDGKADILWRHATMGEAAIWLMNGMTISSSAYLPTSTYLPTVSDLNWQIM